MLTVRMAASLLYQRLLLRSVVPTVKSVVPHAAASSASYATTPNPAGVNESVYAASAAPAISIQHLWLDLHSVASMAAHLTLASLAAPTQCMSCLVQQVA